MISALDAQCINLSNINASTLSESNDGGSSVINSSSSSTTKITKPILMCFICKLSFGNTKSFGLHANTEHSLNLQECEKILLSREYSSAIIQRNVDEKPQISFLEPLEMHKQQQQHSNQSKISDETNANTQIQMDSSTITTTTSTAVTTATTTNIEKIQSSTKCNNNDTLSSGKGVHHNTDGLTNTQTSLSPQPSNTISNSNRPANTPTPENCNNPLSNNNNKLLNDFILQQQSLNLHRGDRSTPSLLATLQQQQQLLLQQPLGCPEHPTVKGLDCKTCEMLECNFFGLASGGCGGSSGIKSPITPTKSPNSVLNLANSTSPPGSTSLTMSPTSQPAPSFTIGACPEHVNGRPFGVECTRYA